MLAVVDVMVELMADAGAVTDEELESAVEKESNCKSESAVISNVRCMFTVEVADGTEKNQVEGKEEY